MTARERADAIEAAILASLRQLDPTMPLGEAIATGVVRAAANNAATCISLTEDDDGDEG